MSLINHEELKRQIASGELTSLDDIANVFKNILKEVIQTASEDDSKDFIIMAICNPPNFNFKLT